MFARPNNLADPLTAAYPCLGRFFELIKIGIKKHFYLYHVADSALFILCIATKKYPRRVHALPLMAVPKSRTSRHSSGAGY
jgi:hypothetical protein